MGKFFNEVLLRRQNTGNIHVCLSLLKPHRLQMKYEVEAILNKVNSAVGMKIQKTQGKIILTLPSTPCLSQSLTNIQLLQMFLCNAPEHRS